MPVLKLENFSGIAPRIGPTQLQPEQAQIARNVRVTSFELRSWRKATKVYQPAVNDVRSIYKLYKESTNDFVWLTWAADVDVVRGPIADDTDFRIYYTGDGVPKKTNWNLATTTETGVAPYPNASLNMGVRAPAAAPTLSASGGTSPTETRAYVYTNVSTFGSIKEESAPSPAATVTCNTTGATVTVSGFSSVAISGYNITHRRIYRTVVGAATVTYQLVAEIPVATTSYNDTSTVADLGSVLQTQNWNEPPDGLRGIVSMPNGMLAGFVDNEVWFSEPYYPQAWPDLYTLVVDSKVVGLGVYDTTLVVMTERQPYLITGNSPLALSQTKLPVPQPCVAKRSIASDQYGVLYASPNGLVSIAPGGSDVISNPLYTRQEWQELSPSSMVGMIYNNQYLGFYTVGNDTRALVLTRGDIPPLVEFDFDAVAVFVDKSNASVFAVSKFDNAIYQLDSSPVNDTIYEWKSKKFIMPAPTNFAAMKLRADYDVITDAQIYAALVQSIITNNQTLWGMSGANLNGVFNSYTFNTYVVNGSILQDIPEIGETRSINVFLFADEQLFFQTSVTNNEPIRLPGGSKAYVWEVEITGNVPVRTFAMATNISELREVIE
jgi:hypothetical protein